MKHPKKKNVGSHKSHSHHVQSQAHHVHTDTSAQQVQAAVDSASKLNPSSKKIAIAVILGIIFISAISALITVMTSSKPTQVLLETTMGNITIEMYSDMPITTGNFEKLVSQGFYDGVIFHRIIANFMIQGGDPTGTGMGGPGYKIKDEFSVNPAHNRNDKGTISMANAGPNTGGSQFFINLVNNNYLDKKHPVFGKVVSGMDVVEAMGRVRTGAGDKPLTPVVIKKATIIK